MDLFHSQGFQGLDPTSGAFEVRDRSPSPDCPLRLLKWMCKAQMVQSHVRSERRDPETNALINVTDTMSFCNHHGFPDEMVLEIAQEVYEERQYLLLRDTSVTDACAEEWPDFVNFIQHHTSVPGVEQMFKDPVGGSTDSCNRCNYLGLHKLSQYYSRVHEQKLDSETTEEEQKLHSETTEETPYEDWKAESASPASSPNDTIVENENSTFLEYLDKITFISNNYNYSIRSWLDSSVTGSPQDEDV